MDCLIIGAGPAGLTAAIYLARFHLNVGVIDAGKSRALLIPETHNHAGFPGGISGPDLIDRMRQQAVKYGAAIQEGKVTNLEIQSDVFMARFGDEEISARTILLATGVVNRRPEIEDGLHAQALEAGRLRYCPICDGFEVTDQNVAVIGTGERGLAEAEFLRSYTKNVTLISPEGPHNLGKNEQSRAANFDIALLDGPVRIDRIIDGKIIVSVDGDELDFECVYPALGSSVNNMLAIELGADCGEDDGIKVDSHQRTSVPGLYAAGDVVIGLDQISHAMGEGGVAAVTIRNDLAEHRPLLR